MLFLFGPRCFAVWFQKIPQTSPRLALTHVDSLSNVQATKEPLPGHGRGNAKVLTDADDIALPVEWGRQQPAPPVAAGRRVVLRLFFRDATVYSVDAKSVWALTL